MTPTPNAKQQVRHGAAGRDDVDHYAALVWHGGDPKPKRLWFDSPVEALMCAIEYLKTGYQCRLTDGAVVAFAAAARSGPNGDGAANVETLLGGRGRHVMRQRILAELAEMLPADRDHALALARRPGGA